jgi:hypothetical protein
MKYLFEIISVKRNFEKTSSRFAPWIPARLIILSRENGCHRRRFARRF